MRAFLCALCVGAFLSQPALADWETPELDGSGSTPSPVVMSTQAKVWYYYIAQGVTTTSSPLYIPDGFLAEICLDDDYTLLAHGGNAVTVQILHHPETLQSATVSVTRSFELLGATLDGQGSTSSPTDCIYEVTGPRWITADIIITPSTNAALLSVISRKAQKD